jgi:hypothetical protein
VRYHLHLYGRIHLGAEPQSLADDREKISQLFLQSMRATNSGINDTILASERVRPSALLATLDTQIPLLEKALELAPEDGKLIRHLEIMYHYKSLCHLDEIIGAGDSNHEVQRTKAIEARRKSLGYIEILIQRKPHDENLSVARINGLYHYRNVLETMMQLKFHWANEALEDKPEERVQVLQEITETNQQMFRDDPSNVSLLFHALESLNARGCLLLQLDRPKEACTDFESFDRELKLYQDLLLKNWSSKEMLCVQFVYRCEALLQAKEYENAVSSAAMWREVISHQDFPKYSIIFGRYFYRLDSVLLFPEYYQWSALFLDDPESEEMRVSRERLTDRMMNCYCTWPAELESFLSVIEQRSSSDSIPAQMLLDEMSQLFSSR